MKIIKDAKNEAFNFYDGVSLIVTITPQESAMQSLFVPSWEESEQDETLSLEDIRNQVEAVHGKSLILVIAVYPLGGKVYRYGNYEDCGWCEVGRMCGYA